jgi:nicotinate-nucleotide pyrophosphorylase (carboxylating)
MPDARKRDVERALFRGKNLTLKNKEYLGAARAILGTLVDTDTLPRDATVSALNISKRAGAAQIIARQPGVAAGLEEYAWLFRRHGLEVVLKKEDGDVFSTGEALVRIEGPQTTILTLERVGLNLLQRMCGIATATQRMQERASRRCPSTRIVGTRKTPWGLLDKRALHLGGGGTHRINLADGIVIKNNHLALLNRKEEVAAPMAVALAWQKRKRVAFIEVEVRSELAAFAAAREFNRLKKETGAISRDYPVFIMLDNMLPEDVRSIIVDLRKAKLWDTILIEASGGISEANVETYADTEVDVISMGSLTHSARALDLSQRPA